MFWTTLGPGFGRVFRPAYSPCLAILAATTQGTASSIVLMMELTGRDRSFIVPMLVAVGTATLVARTVELRSIYETRLSDEQVEQRRRAREAGGSIPT